MRRGGSVPPGSLKGIGADRSTTERLLLSIGAKAKARKSGRSIRSECCFHT